MSRPHWLALLSSCSSDEAAPAAAASARQQALAWWSLQFSPRVTLLEEAVLLELEGSLRLFGGLRALHRRMREAGRPLGLGRMAWAPTPLAALALARSGIVDGLRPPLPPLLDRLSLHSLSAVQAQAAMLERLGCRTLGDVRALPRAATARRFGDALLLALDQAYGEAPLAHAWISLPERFSARLELPWRIEHAPALAHHAGLLLQQLCAWLAARHAGVLRLTLAWQHDAMRARDAGSGGNLSLAVAEATRELRPLSRLLGEHLARLELAAPVGELQLLADEVQALDERSLSLLPAAPEQAREPLPQLLARMAVRLGAEQLRRGQLSADHRPERMQRWLPWAQVLPKSTLSGADFPPPQPSWLLEPPLRLATRQDQPLLHGPLQLLAGPQRLEGGWWGSPGQARPQPGDHVQRDYYLARSPQAGLLWIFHERLGAGASERAAWYLHGVFA